MTNSKMKKVGAGWKKESQKGKPFMSVVINGGLMPDIHLTIWANGFKENDEQPDYFVYLSEQLAARTEEKPKSEFPGDNETHSDEDVPF
jgi:uncharacterized protein (DUF736 family)